MKKNTDNIPKLKQEYGNKLQVIKKSIIKERQPPIHGNIVYDFLCNASMKKNTKSQQIKK